MRNFTAKTRALVALAMLAGCTHESDQSDTANSDDTKGATDAEDFAIDAAEDALLRESVGGHLEACEGVRDACGGEDSREDKGRPRLRQSGPSDVCKSEVRECLSAVVERAKTVIRALHACRDSALECVADDGERMACRKEFRACVASVFHGDGGTRDAGSRDAGLDGGSGRSRRDAGTRGTETPRGSGGVISPVSQLDGGTRRDAGAAGRGTSSGGLSSEACIAQLEACAESNQDPDMCAATATACVGRE